MARLAVLASILLAASAQAATPGFDASVSRVSRADLPHSYRPGCPLRPTALRAIRTRHWGFDGRPHTGTLVVHASVVPQVLAVLRKLYAARFPIRRMRGVEVYKGSDDRSMAADNTSGFNCRRVYPGGPRAQHAHREAIDRQPLEKPFATGGG